MQEETYFHDKWGNLKENWEIVIMIAVVIAIIAFIVGLMVALSMWGETSRCDDLASFNQHMEFVWTRMNGCMVRTSEGGMMMPIDKVFELVNQ